MPHVIWRAASTLIACGATIGGSYGEHDRTALSATAAEQGDNWKTPPLRPATSRASAVGFSWPFSPDGVECVTANSKRQKRRIRRVMDRKLKKLLYAVMFPVIRKGKLAGLEEKFFKSKNRAKEAFQEAEERLAAFEPSDSKYLTPHRAPHKAMTKARRKKKSQRRRIRALLAAAGRSPKVKPQQQAPGNMGMLAALAAGGGFGNSPRRSTSFGGTPAATTTAGQAAPSLFTKTPTAATTTAPGTAAAIGNAGAGVATINPVLQQQSSSISHGQTLSGVANSNQATLSEAAGPANTVKTSAAVLSNRSRGTLSRAGSVGPNTGGIEGVLNGPLKRVEWGSFAELDENVNPELFLTGNEPKGAVPGTGPLQEEANKRTEALAAQILQKQLEEAEKETAALAAIIKADPPSYTPPLAGHFIGEIRSQLPRRVTDANIVGTRGRTDIVRFALEGTTWGYPVATFTPAVPVDPVIVNPFAIFSAAHRLETLHAVWSDFSQRGVPFNSQYCLSCVNSAVEDFRSFCRPLNEFTGVPASAFVVPGQEIRRLMPEILKCYNLLSVAAPDLNALGKALEQLKLTTTEFSRYACNTVFERMRDPRSFLSKGNTARNHFHRLNSIGQQVETMATMSRSLGRGATYFEAHVVHNEEMTLGNDALRRLCRLTRDFTFGTHFGGSNVSFRCRRLMEGGSPTSGNEIVAHVFYPRADLSNHDMRLLDRCFEHLTSLNNAYSQLHRHAMDTDLLTGGEFQAPKQQPLQCKSIMEPLVMLVDRPIDLSVDPAPYIRCLTEYLGRVALRFAHSGYGFHAKYRKVDGKWKGEAPVDVRTKDDLRNLAASVSQKSYADALFSDPHLLAKRGAASLLLDSLHSALSDTPTAEGQHINTTNNLIDEEINQYQSCIDTTHFEFPPTKVGSRCRCLFLF